LPLASCLLALAAPMPPADWQVMYTVTDFVTLSVHNRTPHSDALVCAVGAAEYCPL